MWMPHEIYISCSDHSQAPNLNNQLSPYAYPTDIPIHTSLSQLVILPSIHKPRSHFCYSLFLSLLVQSVIKSHPSFPTHTASHRSLLSLLWNMNGFLTWISASNHDTLQAIIHTFHKKIPDFQIMGFLIIFITLKFNFTVIGKHDFYHSKFFKIYWLLLYRPACSQFS